LIIKDDAKLVDRMNDGDDDSRGSIEFDIIVMGLKKFKDLWEILFFCCSSSNTSINK
jgi:hypothetical protein